PYTVSDETFLRVATLATEIDAPIHLHLHETVDEIASGCQATGMRPLARLAQLGLVNERLIAVHAVHLQDDEIDLLAERGCHIAHCPTSNMKLASGIAPVAKMLARGLSVGLGSDGAASNNRLDLFAEMRQAALLAKVTANDAACLPAHQVLRLATLAGARALGLGDEIGSLTAGKSADCIAVALDDWLVKPCYDPISHLVFTLGREAVSHVWVAGKLRIDDKRPCGFDDRSLLESTQMWQNALARQSL
ncbi:MAG: amidohydrolase family protein, partial [Rhodocyclaceae bacterium]|nr:amidohydrolase family protein [Rhodocyclaceae bacterium]